MAAVPFRVPAHCAEYITEREGIMGRREMLKRDAGVRFLYLVSEKILETYEIKHWPSVMRNRKTSLHRRRNGTSQLLFSWSNVQRQWYCGAREYKTVARAMREVNERSEPGWHALRQVLLHECAHALQYEVPNGRTRGSIHNEVFMAEYRALLERYDLDRCLTMAGLTLDSKPPWEEPKVEEPTTAQTSFIAPKPQTELLIGRIKIKEKAQFWSARQQKDGKINLSFGRKYYAKMTSTERQLLLEYCMATMRKSLFRVPIPPDLRGQYLALRLRVGGW